MRVRDSHKSYRNEIIIALIGLFGVLTSAFLSNVDKFFPKKDIINYESEYNKQRDRIEELNEIISNKQRNIDNITISLNAKTEEIEAYKKIKSMSDNEKDNKILELQTKNEELSISNNDFIVRLNLATIELDKYRKNDLPSVNIIVQPSSFSPDLDGVEDELSIQIDTIDNSKMIKEWKIEITDTIGNVAIAFQGKGKPTERIIWDGRDASGKIVPALNKYLVLMSTELNNNQIIRTFSEFEADICTFRDGASITTGNLSSIIDFANGFIVPKNDNNSVLENRLRRITQVLQKFRDYKIDIKSSFMIVNNKDIRLTVDQIGKINEFRTSMVQKYLVSQGIDNSRFLKNSSVNNTYDNYIKIDLIK